MGEVRPIDANSIHYTRVLAQNGFDMELASKLSIEKMPTLDYEPVRHGRWELWEDDCQAESWLQCSECGRKVMLEYDDWVTDEDVPHLTEQYPYCHCGAKMDGGEENGKNA